MGEGRREEGGTNLLSRRAKGRVNLHIEIERSPGSPRFLYVPVLARSPDDAPAAYYRRMRRFLLSKK